MKMNNNLRSTLRVARIELNSMFYSPVAWLVIIIFVCQVGYAFCQKFGGFLHSQDISGMNSPGITVNLFTGMLGILAPIKGTLYLYIPLITMGLMSREYQSGSIKLLYSSPIKNRSIILGKFVSMMVYGAALLGILIFITLFCTVFIKDFDYPILLSALLGFYLLILAYSAIGIFMSSITQYQVVAAIGTLTVLAALNYVGGIGQSVETVRDITYWLSISDRVEDFLRGLIASEDVIYFILIIALFLGLSIFKLTTEKTIMSRGRKVGGYALIVVAFVALGYLTSRPQTKFYCDVTQDRENTLSSESQRIVKDVKREKGDVKIITYVNILDQNYFSGMPNDRMGDRERFEKYFRFMPGIKMEYVLYWDDPMAPSFPAQNSSAEGKSLQETAEWVCESLGLEFDEVLTPDEFREQYEDLSAEGNRFLRVLETADGERVFVRMFNDSFTYPNEAEISAAMSRLVCRAPQVGFYTDNPARTIDNYGDRGYYLFAYDKWFRSSLPNNGFDTRMVDPAAESLDDIDILIVYDLRQTPSEETMAGIRRFYDRGGNMFVAGDYRRAESMAPIGDMLGVDFSEGVLVETGDGRNDGDGPAMQAEKTEDFRDPTILSLRFTREAGEKFPYYETRRRYGFRVSANMAAALDYSGAADHGFSVTPVLRTRTGVWTEMETTDFVDRRPVYNPEAGELRDSMVVMAALARQVGEREQRIVVSGDADIIANGELTSSRPMGANNYTVITGSFRWLSDDRYPVDTQLPDKTDDRIRLPQGSRKWVNWLFIGFIPAALLMAGAIVIIRRQRK